jgi:Glycosyl transferases group 1
MSLTPCLVAYAHWAQDGSNGPAPRATPFPVPTSLRAVRLAGYLTGVMGTGEHGRQLAGALRAQGIPVLTTTIHGPGALEDESLAPAADDSAAADRFATVNLLCVNADSVAMVARQLGDAFFDDRYTIGFWAWEVGAFPEQFQGAFDHLDEVWVGSRHVRDAIAPGATKPVIAIPQPVSMTLEAERAPAPGGLPGGFRFLFAFDYLSIFQRKNPLATVAAFARAFPRDGDAEASLIVKSLNHDHNPSAHERLRAAAADHAGVHLIQERLSKRDRDGLLASADCYVSLHRAEGFGYTLAESMWLGKPVIATGYSGNLDFMSAANSYLVEHQLVPIGPGSEPYPPDGVWAQPDVDHAARLMREVFENREEAARRGAQAAVDIRASNGPEAAGRAMAARLEALEAEGTLRGRRTRGGGMLRRLLGRG